MSHLRKELATVDLMSCPPASQNGMEKRANSTPPPARALTVQNATKAFHTSAKAPVETETPAGVGGLGWGEAGRAGVTHGLQGVRQLQRDGMVHTIPSLL